MNFMTHLVYLTTTRFDGLKEEANPYNPIAGKALLSWLGEQLARTGWEVTGPDAEDWGWFIIARKNGDSYLVGASGEMDGDNMPPDWIIQIHRNRTFIEKLTGKNKLLDDDTLTREIGGILLRDTGTEKVNVDLNA